MEQILEFLKAESMARREADKAQSEAEKKANKAEKAEMMAKMDSNQEMIARMMAGQERTNANLEEMKATVRSGQEEMIKALMVACREATEGCEGVMPACLEEKEPAPEATEVVSEPQEVPERAMDAETIRATEDRSRDLRLAVGCRRKLKTQTKRDGRVRREHAATIGWPTRRTVPAICKGGLHKGLGKKCHCGIQGPGRTIGSRMEGRSLKKRRAKGNAIRGTPKGRTGKKRRRTCLECDNGIRDRGARQHREAIRKSLCREIARLIFESSIRLWELGHGALWKCRPPPKWKRKHHNGALGSGREGQQRWLRFGDTKEGAFGE
jgi:hypothetical protein